jgi:hypothetical protein
VVCELRGERVAVFYPFEFPSNSFEVSSGGLHPEKDRPRVSSTVRNKPRSSTEVYFKL